MAKDRTKQIEAFTRLLDVMDELREKCPWDKKQTLDSLRPNTIEETYELCDAIAKHDMKDVKKELGDVLLHIVFYSKIASETNDFDISDVCNSLCEKLIYRHPHVFGEAAAKNAGEVELNWEQLKMKEKDGNKTVLSGVPSALPSLIKAYRIQDKARNVGFDWEDKEQIWDKVQEELNELREEIKKGDNINMEKEFGDLMFSMINAARLYKINPDNALESTNNKFIFRFNYLESQTIKKGIDLKTLTLEEMDKYWNEAKELEKKQNMKKITVAIDGFSSCGKSTMAKALAKKVGYSYVDSGAMYRSVTLYALRHNFISNGVVDTHALEKEMNNIRIEFKFNPELGKSETYLNDENVEREIRLMEVSNNVSPIAAIPFVRHALVDLQRKMGEKGGIVMDGRDIGTTVFPNAELKIFVTASAEVRADRRYKELVEKEGSANYDEILANVKERDHIDMTRTESPLRKAEDAVELDNGLMTIEEQDAWLMKIFNERTK